MSSLIEENFILVDFCIIDYWLSKEAGLAENIAEVLLKLRKKRNRLFISEFTYFEVLRGISDNKRQQAENLLGWFEKVDITMDRLQKGH